MKQLVRNRKNGFTLIELLVVIAIIGLLAAMSMVALNSARKQAKITRARADMKMVVDAVTIAQGESGKWLLQITGSGCSACACPLTSLINISDTNNCFIAWQRAVTKISDATNGLFMGITKIERDPWGSPYLLDENEGEGSCTRIDSIVSAGENGLRGDGDDVYMSIPLSGFCN